MPTSPTAHAVRYLRGIASDAGQVDADLLGRFIDRRDEGAFALLVRRHGAMVYGVCRRLLPTDQDAEDAFQATFLVLVEKARTVVPREAVGNWLFGVARRAALLARRTITRRRERVGELSECPAAEPDPLGELRAVLDEELSRLPDTYRTVIVLCDLEERTRREVAAQLGWPEGTVAGRLARAREMLAKRLARRGVVLSAGPLATVLAQNVATAGVPDAVVSNTIRAAGFLAAGQATAGMASPRVTALTEGVLKAMLVSKLKVSVAVALVLGLVATGAAVFAGRPVATQGDNPPVAKEPVEAPRKDKTASTTPDRAVDALQGEWRVVAWEDEGRKAPVEDLKGKNAVITGNEITGIGPGPTGKMSFKLDPGKTPKEIDLTVLDGKQKGTTHSGIYEMDGQRLRICNGGKVRPTKFTTAPGDGRTMITLEKVGVTAWGKEVDGLQMGVGFGPGAPRVYQVGESVQLTVKLRNNSDAPIRYTLPTAPARSRVPTVRDAAGRAVSVKQSWPPDSQLKEDTLKPREEVVLDHAGFDLEPLGGANDPNNHILRVKPGTYLVGYARLLESHRSLATGFAEFEVQDSPPVTPPEKPVGKEDKSVTLTPRIVPSKDEKGTNLLAARLVLNDHGVRSGCRVYSAGIEVENLSGRAATVHFDPKDLKLELLATDGKVIDEAGLPRSGPAPIAHDATIPTSRYVGFSTYRGGIALTPKSILFAAGFQDWTVKRGTYRLRGTVTVTVKYGDAVLDPGKPELPRGEIGDGKVILKLSEQRFELKGP